MFAEAYLQCAQELLGSYTLQQPLHLFLKAYFKQHRQFGSRDRKYISELVYAYYRLGKQQTEHSLREQIIRAAWIKSNLPKRFFERMLPELAERFEEPAGEKLRWSAQHEGIQIPVPFALSEQQQSAFFIDLLLGNPRVFIRIRKNKAGIVKALQQAALPYREEHASERMGGGVCADATAGTDNSHTSPRRVTTAEPSREITAAPCETSCQTRCMEGASLAQPVASEANRFMRNALSGRLQGRNPGTRPSGQTIGEDRGTPPPSPAHRRARRAALSRRTRSPSPAPSASGRA